MITTEQHSDAVKEAAYVYRKAEAAEYKALPVRGTVMLRMEQDPDLKEVVGAAWSDVQTRIEAHFTAMIPKTKRARDRGEGPSVFEVIHAYEVARECFHLALYRQISTAAPVDAAAAADLTLRRLGIIGDPEAFFLNPAEAS